MVSQGNCVQQTDNFIVTEIQTKAKPVIQVYPNPAEDFFLIQIPENEHPVALEIKNAAGRVIEKYLL